MSKLASRFDIVSLQNPAIKELFHLRSRRRVRQRKDLVLVRGRQLILSIGESFPFKRVYTHEPHEKYESYKAERVVRVDKPVLRHVLFGSSKKDTLRILDDDEFVVGTIQPPPPVTDFAETSRRLLAIDGVKTPENMGLLLTSAVALKFDGIVLLDGCVDPFNYKVIEASQAVAWTLPYRFGTAADVLEICRRHCLAPCAADLRGTPLSELPPRDKAHDGFCLAIGNEARGVSEQLLRKCTRVALPMSELVDSLNAGVAGGILMHGLACAWGA